MEAGWALCINTGIFYLSGVRKYHVDRLQKLDVVGLFFYFQITGQGNFSTVKANACVYKGMLYQNYI